MSVVAACGLGIWRKLLRLSVLGLGGASVCGCIPSYSCDAACQEQQHRHAACTAGNARQCEALGRYDRACLLGSTYACYAAGAELDPREHLIDADLEAAVRFYRLACDGSRLRGCIRAGTLRMTQPAGQLGRGRELLGRACHDAAVSDCIRAERRWLSRVTADIDAQDEDRFRQQCTAVYVEACRELSLASADGIDGPVEEGRAQQLMATACGADDAEACMFLGYYHYAGIGVPADQQAALALFDQSCKAEVGDACSAAHVLRDDEKPQTVRILARLIDEETHTFGHRAAAVQPHGLPPVGAPVQALSFISMSGTVSFSGGRMTAVKGRLISAAPTRMSLAEQRFQNILRIGYTTGGLMMLEWAAPDPSLEDSDCGQTEDCEERGLCAAQAGYCRPSESGCAAATTCRTSGHCGLVDDRCAARNDADCRNSAACHEGKRCQADAGWCIR